MTTDCNNIILLADKHNIPKGKMHSNSKQHSLHAVKLSQWSGKPCANCVDPFRPQQWGPNYRFGASRPCGPTGWLAMLLIKVGDVETNPGPTTTRKQIWIYDICHRQIQVRKQISIYLEYASSKWCCCCLPTPMTLASGGSPMFPLVVH